MKLGFALGPLVMIDGTRANSRVSALVVFEVCGLKKGETHFKAPGIPRNLLLTGS